MERIIKQRSGITLVSLVITIIVLLILAGVTINLIIGEDGIIKRAQEAGKNYINAAGYEQWQLAEFTNEMDNIISNSSTNNGRTPYNSAFRKNVVAAIKNEGVETLETDTDEKIIANIGKIFEEKTKLDSEVAATADNITAGKQAYVNGQLITGNGSDNNAYIESHIKNLYGSSTSVTNVISGKSINSYIWHGKVGSWGSESDSFDFNSDEINIFSTPEGKKAALISITFTVSNSNSHSSYGGEQSSSTSSYTLKLSDGTIIASGSTCNNLTVNLLNYDIGDNKSIILTASGSGSCMVSTATGSEAKFSAGISNVELLYKTLD